jgi:hypothetical protein
MQPAVPLWKVIVGFAPAKLCNRARKGPVFSFVMRHVEEIARTDNGIRVACILAIELALRHVHFRSPSKKKYFDAATMLTAARRAWQNRTMRNAH